MGVSRKNTIPMSLAQLRNRDKKIVKKMMLLFAAFEMEELGCKEDKIIELWDGLSTYVNAIDTHLITMNTVSDIVYEYTGMRVKWED